MMFTAKRNATLLDGDDFVTQSASGQLIDVREGDAYKRSHAMGARNIPANNFTQGKAGLRFDKGIYLYDANVRSAVRVAKLLTKQGYDKAQIFILKGGYSQYTGKTTK
jgi:rhodanese-related sulfurtransferase